MVVVGQRKCVKPEGNALLIIYKPRYINRMQINGVLCAIGWLVSCHGNMMYDRSWLAGWIVCCIHSANFDLVYIFISYTGYKEMSAGINWNK